MSTDAVAPHAPSRARLRRLAAALLIAAVAAVLVARAGAEAGAAPAAPRPAAPWEVWTVDQSDTRPDGGGVLHVFDGPKLNGDAAAKAAPESVDLGGRTRALCLERTGTAPRRPHMIVFNGGHDSAAGASHAALAFVVSGHVVFFDAATREPLECIDAGAQAHAVWPTPDQRYMIVANQNGKLLQRIATDYANERFALERDATLDLANCTTPSGARCQDPVLRPDNAPICPRTDEAGRFTFVTLRGGGMFVVDHNADRMRIVAEYDQSAVHPAGCGSIEAAGKMYINSGGPHHDVYAVTLDELSTTPTPPNTPPARTVYSLDGRGALDSHGVLLMRHQRYLWVADRAANFVVVVDPETDAVVNEFSLAGEVSADPAPDLLDVSPSGNRAFAALRGPNPQSGGHLAVGSTPGVGVIEVLDGGRSGRLKAVAGLSRIEAGVERADPHAIRVRRVPPGER